MAASRNGVILESYARSAGTADAPIPSEVTSRRTTSRHERLQLQKKREEDQEKVRKQRKEQEAIAKILQKKWAEEDLKRETKRKRKNSSSSDDTEEEYRKDRKSRRSSDDRDKEEVAKKLAQMWAEEEEAEEKHEAKEERIGGWVSLNRGSEIQEKVEREPEHLPERPSERGAWGHQSRVAAELKAGSSKKRKVAGVFGLSEDEDDGDTRMKKELERAARSKAQRLPSGLAAPSSSSAPSPVPASARQSSAQMDLSTALMKMAEWKRSCGGKRVPMPEDMKLAVAAAMRGSV